MNGSTVALRIAVLAALATRLVLAQESPAEREQTVSLLVTAIAGDSIYLDHGRDVGLQVGSRVQLFPPEGGEVEAVVRSLSHTSARAVLPPGVPLPPVGTRGEAVVMQVASVGQASPSTPQPQPVHPPWTRNESPRSPDQPLLVPTFGQRPDQRPATYDGRWFSFGQWNRDRGDDRDSDYLLLRTGLRADASNVFGAGERVRLAGEYDVRQVQLPDAADQNDQNGRIDLASVAFGTEAYAPLCAEFGRFLSPFLPEIGLVDGAEVVFRYEGGLRFGGGLGAYPRPFPARDAGDDLGVHAFVDYVADAERSFAATAGVQKTWHKGAADRDLILLRSEWRPASGLSLLGNAKVDIYTGSDTIKGSGAELTELLLQARYTQRSTGIGLTASRFTWPELKRAEYQFLSVDLVQNGKVDRVSLFGSWRPLTWLSLRLRGDRWQDQVRSGSSVRGDVDVRGPLGAGSSLGLSVFENNGSYTSGPGLRVALRDRLGGGFWQVDYRWHRYSVDSLVTGPETYARQSVAARLSWPIGQSTDLDLTGEKWFGDGQDAVAIGFYLQWRF